MKTFMMSMLVQRYGQVTPDAFCTSFAHDFLVWEPGHWHPARSGANTRVLSERGTGDTPVSLGREALVLALLPTRKDATSLVLGRGEECDLCINDATLSQKHLSFTTTSQGWKVTDLGSRNGTWINERKLVPSLPVMLLPGSTLKVGQVLLRYCSPSELHARIQQQVSAALAARKT
jgi:hypothetical protein